VLLRKHDAPASGLRPGAGGFSQRGIRALPALLALVGAAALAAIPFPAEAGSASSRYPDLAMARLKDFSLVIPPEGQKQLRFSTKMVNIGTGPFELMASRSLLERRFSVSQRIRRSDGSSHQIRTSRVALVYAGHGHNHWHVRDVAQYELRRLDNWRKVAAGAKRGFCFYDSHPYQRSLPRAPAKRAYPKNSCGTRDSVRLLMGISVGWLDAYFWRLPDQYIDVAKVPNGKYRLAATVDPAGWFKESNERNNRTWANLEITATGIKVLRYGPPPA
jgi:Lysyl oxidase